MADTLTFDHVFASYRSTIAASRRMVFFLLPLMLFLVLFAEETIRSREAADQESTHEVTETLKKVSDYRKVLMKQAGEIEKCAFGRELLVDLPKPFPRNKLIELADDPNDPLLGQHSLHQKRNETPEDAILRLKENQKRIAGLNSVGELNDFDDVLRKFLTSPESLSGTDKPKVKTIKRAFTTGERLDTGEWKPGPQSDDDAEENINRVKKYVNSYKEFYRLQLSHITAVKRASDQRDDNRTKTHKFPTPVGTLDLSPRLALLIFAFVNVVIFISVQILTYRVHAILPLCGVLAAGQAKETVIAEPPPFWTFPLPSEWYRALGDGPNADTWKSWIGIAFTWLWLVLIGVNVFEAVFWLDDDTLRLVPPALVTTGLLILTGAAALLAVHRTFAHETNAGDFVTSVFAGRYVKAYVDHVGPSKVRRRLVFGGAAAGALVAADFAVGMFDAATDDLAEGLAKSIFSEQTVTQPYSADDQRRVVALVDSIAQHPHRAELYDRLANIYGKYKRYDDIWTLYNEGKQVVAALGRESGGRVRKWEVAGELLDERIERVRALRETQSGTNA